MMKHCRAALICALALLPWSPTLAETTQVTDASAAVTSSSPGVVPVRTFIAAGQPLTVQVNSQSPVELLLVDFIGRSTSMRSPTTVSGVVDIQTLFREPLSNPGTYQLLAVAPGADAANFIGTPLVVEVRDDRRRGAPSGPMFYKFEPLRYGVLSTTAGEMKICFYYDTAPNNVAAVQRLMVGGFYNGLEFFRVEPGFVIQTGDPRNDGTGGPGFNTPAEFSDRQHLPGVLSMARLTDPNEAPGLLPRPEFANSSGSQFFIALNFASTKQLDRRFTAIGRVIDGMDTVRAIAASPLRDKSIQPVNPPKVTGAKLVLVTADDNPYARLRVVETPDAADTPQDLSTLPPPAQAPDAPTTSPSVR